jgi:hypothetical protein
MNAILKKYLANPKEELQALPQGTGLEGFVPEINLPYVQFVVGTSECLVPGEKYDETARPQTFRLAKTPEGVEAQIGKEVYLQFLAQTLLAIISEFDEATGKWVEVGKELVTGAKPRVFELSEYPKVYGREIIKGGRRVAQKVQYEYRTAARLLNRDEPLTVVLYLSSYRESNFRNLLSTISTKHPEEGLIGGIWKLTAASEKIKAANGEDGFKYEYVFEHMGSANNDLRTEGLALHTEAAQTLKLGTTETGTTPIEVMQAPPRLPALPENQITPQAVPPQLQLYTK